MKRMLSILIAAMLVFSLAFTGSAVFDSGEVTDQLKSEAYFMQSLDEGTVIFKKNEDKKLPMAGYVKIVAAVTALQKWPDLDEKVKITEENLSLIKYDYTVRRAGYKAGESVSKRELINSLVVYGANDSASVIAYEISGSFDAFITEMNSTVKSVGCESTAIKNLTGFDVDGQYTTASDIAKLVKFAMDIPAFSEAFSATSVTLKQTDLNSERTYQASNRMRNKNVPDYYHESVNAGKQTSTEKAGECISVISAQDGYTYIVVVLKGHLEDVDRDGVNENTAMTDAKKMLDWTYKNIRYRVVVSPSQVVAVIDVVAGKGTDVVKLVPEKEGSALVPANATPASVLYEVIPTSAPEKLRAPVKQGEVIAKAKVYYAGQVLSEVNLVAQETVKLSFFGLIATGISAIMTSTFFILVVGIAALAALGYFALLLKKYLIDTGVLTSKTPVKSAAQKPSAKKPAAKSAPVKRAPTGKTPQRNGAASKAGAKSAPKKPSSKGIDFKMPEIDLSKIKKTIGKYIKEKE